MKPESQQSAGTPGDGGSEINEDMRQCVVGGFNFGGEIKI
jgi:hypothetical protein